MTNQVKCDIYYSVSGEPFAITDRDKGHIEHVSTILHIYTREEEEMPNTTAIQKVADVTTELSVPVPIKKGQFFNSESYCIFLNESGELLKIEDVYLFRIYMMRDGNDHERLHIKFESPFYNGKHGWELPHKVLATH